MKKRKKQSLDNEFIPYNEALALKELKFKEPCVKFYSSSANAGDYDFTQIWWGHVIEKVPPFEQETVTANLLTNDKSCLAPTYHQAFKWFREKHNLRSYLDQRVYGCDSPNKWVYDYVITFGNGVDIRPFFSGDFKTYEASELNCLQKLIKFVNNPELINQNNEKKD